MAEQPEELAFEAWEACLRMTVHMKDYNVCAAGGTDLDTLKTQEAAGAVRTENSLNIPNERNRTFTLASMEGMSFFSASSRFQLSLKWSRFAGWTRNLAVDVAKSSCKPRSSTMAFW